MEPYTSPEPDELRGQPLPTGAATDSDRQRLEELRVSLDQCWNLLLLRRARRDAAGTRKARSSDREMSFDRYE